MPSLTSIVRSAMHVYVDPSAPCHGRLAPTTRLCGVAIFDLHPWPLRFLSRRPRSRSQSTPPHLRKRRAFLFQALRSAPWRELLAPRSPCLRRREPMNPSVPHFSMPMTHLQGRWSGTRRSASCPAAAPRTPQRPDAARAKTAANQNLGPTDSSDPSRHIPFAPPSICRLVW